MRFGVCIYSTRKPPLLHKPSPHTFTSPYSNHTLRHRSSQVTITALVVDVNGASCCCRRIRYGEETQVMEPPRHDTSGADLHFNQPLAIEGEVHVTAEP
ncbi:hypothetical protein YC2023_066488 [Brassica napus]